jgi:hypothetical protein
MPDCERAADSGSDQICLRHGPDTDGGNDYSRRNTYAGACAATQSPVDHGAYCATFVAEQSGLRAYLIGRTSSEFSEWVFIANRGGGWRVLGTAPFNFVDTSGRIPWPR